MTFKLCKIKLILFCAALLMIAGSITAVAGAASDNTENNSSEAILGDANRDGIVSISDVTCIQMKTADLPLSCGFSERSADVDGNKEIDAADAL